MIDGSRFALFLTAAAILALTPGPGIFYVLGRTLSGGRKDGALSSLGTFAGGLVHAAAAAFGLSAILATSASAFHVVKFAGAAYLVYLGVRIIRTRNLDASASLSARSSSRPLLQGITTEVLNPKTAMFFLSFIPQFVAPEAGHVIAQFLLLGAISVTMNTAVDLLVVASAARLFGQLMQNRAFYRKQRAASGAAMIGIGIYIAASD